MGETFLGLPDGVRQGILAEQAARLGRTPSLLEKDVWVCWTLNELFRIEAMPAMAFRGGTSLSKVYNAIERFSEDIDVSIDHRELAPGIDPEQLSRKARARLCEDIHSMVVLLAHDVVAPAIHDAAQRQLGISLELTFIDEAERIDVGYPSVTGGLDYLQPRVIIELGGRNAIEPSGRHRVTAYAAEGLDGLEFPFAEVEAIAGERTFWEKAALIHIDCKRGVPKVNAERRVRHWYDLYRLADSDIGNNALDARSLLNDVLRYQTLMFGVSETHARQCLARQMRLIPDAPLIDALKSDYRQMLDAGMLFGVPPEFGEMMDRLRQLEGRINAPHDAVEEKQS